MIEAEVQTCQACDAANLCGNSSVCMVVELNARNLILCQDYENQEQLYKERRN